MEYSFSIIGESNRRAILDLLAAGGRSVGDIEAALKLPQPTVSKHLRVLRDAGFVDVKVDAQRRVYTLKPAPLQAIDAWLAPFRRIWSGHLDALEKHLDGMDSRTPQKSRTAAAPKRQQPRISKRSREGNR